VSAGLSEYLGSGQSLSTQELLATAQPVGGTPDGLGATQLLPVAPSRAMPRAVSGSLEKAIPLLKDARRLSGVRGLGSNGSGPVEGLGFLAVVLIATGIAARGVAGYFAGKAMAPSQQKETVYAWTGVGAAIVFGALGLGVQGIVALQSRKS